MCAGEWLGTDLSGGSPGAGPLPVERRAAKGERIMKSKVRHRSLNLFDCVISVPKLINRSFRSSNLFDCVIPVPKLINHLFRYSNLSSHIIQSLNLILSLI